MYNWYKRRIRLLHNGKNLNNKTVEFTEHNDNKNMQEAFPLETLKTLYIGIVEPDFRYCCSLWGCCGITELGHLH